MSVTTSPFDDHVGVVVVSATPEKVVATLDIDPARHTQPYGVVHGGVYATMAETVASIGSFLVAHQFGRVTMGLENHTSFLRAIRGGRVTATAVPVSAGRRTQVWDVSMTSDEGAVVARSTVRLIAVEPRSEV